MDTKFTDFNLSLKLLHISNRKWPWKRLSQMTCLTTISLFIVIILKLSLRTIPLRSSGRQNFNDSSKRLLDIENFRWLMNNESACKKEMGTSKLMVTLVHTARDHFLERKSIRETWGSMKSYKDWSTRVIFLLGEPASSKDLLADDITSEFTNYGDMVMGNFQDTYRHLTYKHLMGYKWILEYCPDATFVWKIDDDIFINPMTLVDWRNNEIIQENSSKKMLDLYCLELTHAEPQRNPSSKWFVSKDLWPSDKYPTYCSGWAYGISMPWIEKIYTVSKSVRKGFWIDDLFVTGVLVKLVHELQQDSPLVKNIWQYITFDYDSFNTTFCYEKDLTQKLDVPRKRIPFGVMGRLLRGDTLLRENRCIWTNIIETIKAKM